MQHPFFVFCHFKWQLNDGCYGNEFLRHEISCSVRKFAVTVSQAKTQLRYQILLVKNGNVFVI